MRPKQLGQTHMPFGRLESVTLGDYYRSNCPGIN
jgi:hypothetical protein